MGVWIKDEPLLKEKEFQFLPGYIESTADTPTIWKEIEKHIDDGADLKCVLNWMGEFPLLSTFEFSIVYRINPFFSLNYSVLLQKPLLELYTLTDHLDSDEAKTKAKLNQNRALKYIFLLLINADVANLDYGILTLKNSEHSLSNTTIMNIGLAINTCVLQWKLFPKGVTDLYNNGEIMRARLLIDNSTKSFWNASARYYWHGSNGPLPPQNLEKTWLYVFAITRDFQMFNTAQLS